MKQKFIILIFLFEFSSQIFGQTDSLKNYTSGVFYIFPVEFPQIDNKLINNKLTEFGFPAIEYPIASFGYGMQIYSNRWITTFSYNKTTKKNKHDNFLTKVEYHSTSLNIGYDLINNYKFSIYPYAGFKGAGLNYLYRERIPDETSINDYFNTSLEYKEITNSNAYLDLGVGISYQKFFLFNLRGGYLIALDNTKWHINNNKNMLSDSPNLDYRYYITLSIGFGSIVNSKIIKKHAQNK